MMSVLDIFKIGIGPSSSHTVGPMKAANSFIKELQDRQLLEQITDLQVELYGSLALTGKGHATDTAVIMGLAGNTPATIDIEIIEPFIKKLQQTGKLPITNTISVNFPLPEAIEFNYETLPLHENGLVFKAFRHKELIYTNTYYSIGGGFIVEESKFHEASSKPINLPYSFKSAADLEQHCQTTGLSLASLVLQNELVLHDEDEINNYFTQIWKTMHLAIEKGSKTDGILPGGLKVPRRAAPLRRALLSDESLSNDPMIVVDWVNMYAFAVSEENAAGGRIVTSPTNGACGIIPAVLAYYDRFIKPLDTESITRFFLTAGVIGVLYKMNASISGAEVGCQGEVGVACSMAAAGLTELLGGSPNQVCIAAEIGMEHHLGLTCDPVAGLVQIPCIERNAIAAVKAINAARMSLRRISQAKVNLDDVIATMYNTGKDMHMKYRETSQGGLAATLKHCE